MEHWEFLDDGSVTVSETPEQLWRNACEYFKYCDTNPIIRKRTLTSGKEAGKRVDEELPRAYSLKGLCIHCGILEEYLSDLRGIKDKESLWYIVASKILYVVYVQNLEHAMVGSFSPIFTQKVLNMEKDESPVSAVTISIVQGLPQLSRSENEILEKLEFEKAENEKLKEQ